MTSTDKEMIALTNEEIKDKFTSLWEALDKYEDGPYAFSACCEGFEHLCHGVLYLKNYGLAGDSANSVLKGCTEIFDEIKKMISDKGGALKK